jgi:hypothetical protein
MFQKLYFHIKVIGIQYESLMILMGRLKELNGEYDEKLFLESI